MPAKLQIARNRFLISDLFWKDFVKKFWRRKPAILKNPFSTSLLTTEEAFAGCLRARKRFRFEESSNIRFFIDQRKQIADLEVYMPAGTDQNLNGYAQRVSALLKKEEGFLFTVADYQKYDAAFWMRVRDFLKGLYARVGLPKTFTTSELYLGKYGVTPFGVHRDAFDVFAFVLAGNKRMRFWKYQDIKKERVLRNPSSYDKWKSRGIRLKATTGDVIYWPSTYWHVAESSASLSLTMNVGIGTEFAQSDDLFGILIRGITGQKLRSWKTKGHHKTLRSNASHAPEPLVAQAAKFLNLDRGEVRLLADKFCLDRVTAYGFEVLAPPENSRLTDRNLICGNPDYPILISDRPNGSQIVCSGNGTSFIAAKNDQLISMIRRLNSGSPYLVANLVRSWPVEDRTTIRTILQHLYQARVLTRL